jgi:hypothetical protein
VGWGTHAACCTVGSLLVSKKHRRRRLCLVLGDLSAPFTTGLKSCPGVIVPASRVVGLTPFPQPHQTGG